MLCVQWLSQQSEIAVSKTTKPGLCSTTIDFITPEVLRSSSWFDRSLWCFYLTNEVRHLSVDPVFILGLTHRIWLHTGHTTGSVTGAVHGAGHAHPSGAPDDTPKFVRVHTVSAFCFVAFVVGSVCSVCVARVVCFLYDLRFAMFFWTYDFLEYPFGFLLRHSFANVSQ